MKQEINDLMKFKEIISNKIKDNHDELIDEIRNSKNTNELKYFDGYSQALTNFKLMLQDAIIEIIKSKG